MRRNLELKAAIVKSGMTQAEVSDIAGVHRQFISMAISGRLNLTETEKAKIADALHVNIEDIFPIDKVTLEKG